MPFSAIGAFWFLYILGYNMSVGVWVGLIALLGVDAETGMFMLLYLDLAYAQAQAREPVHSAADLREAIIEGAVRRLRPKLMTVATMICGLVPIMLSTGTGADVMKRIAAPLLGGIITSFLLELAHLPAVVPDVEMAARFVTRSRRGSSQSFSAVVPAHQHERGRSPRFSGSSPPFPDILAVALHNAASIDRPVRASPHHNRFPGNEHGGEVCRIGVCA